MPSDNIHIGLYAAITTQTALNAKHIICHLRLNRFFVNFMYCDSFMVIVPFCFHIAISGFLVIVFIIGAIVCFHRKIASSDAVREGHLRGKDKRRYCSRLSNPALQVVRRFSLPLRLSLSRSPFPRPLSFAAGRIASVTWCSAYIRLVGGSRRRLLFVS